MKSPPAVCVGGAHPTGTQARVPFLRGIQGLSKGHGGGHGFIPNKHVPPPPLAENHRISKKKQIILKNQLIPWKIYLAS